MDFEEKLIRDIGEEVRNIYAAIVYDIDDAIVYLDVFKEEKNRIECLGFDKAMFDKMNIDIGSRLWVDSFKQPGKMIVKVKQISVEENEIFPETSFLELYRENNIPRPIKRKRSILDSLDIFNL